MFTAADDQVFQAESEFVRKQFGKFTTSADLDKAAMTSPLAAMVKCLGYKGVIPEEFRRMDEHVLAVRAARFRVRRS